LGGESKVEHFYAERQAMLLGKKPAESRHMKLLY
jgi:hypothetical protein